LQARVTVRSAQSTHMLFEQRLAETLVIEPRDHPLPAYCTINRYRAGGRVYPDRFAVIVTFEATLIDVRNGMTSLGFSECRTQPLTGIRGAGVVVGPTYGYRRRVHPHARARARGYTLVHGMDGAIISIAPAGQSGRWFAKPPEQPSHDHPQRGMAVA